MVCHTILKMERMASALSRRICRRSVWKQEYGQRSGENRAIDSGNEAVLPGGSFGMEVVRLRRSVVKLSSRWYSGGQNWKVQDWHNEWQERTYDQGQGNTLSHSCVAERRAEILREITHECFSHTIQSKQVKTGIARGTCANHHPCLVVYWFCFIRHLISFRLTHIYRCSFKNLLTKSSQV